MMDTLLVFRNITVENANAVAGMTWGFPAITHFLGFVHALSRKLRSWPGEKVELDGCGVICHQHQIQAVQPRSWGDYVFALTRNPLTKDEKSPSFVEEGRMHMNVSLLVPVTGRPEDSDERDELVRKIEQLALSQRLAGGTITGIKAIELHTLPEDGYEALKKFERRQLLRLLPGFALVQRSDLLADHTKNCIEQNPGSEPLDAWLDFAALKYEAKPVDDDPGNQTEVEWLAVPKPGGGWLAPITIGYRGISELYEPGKVARARDMSTPFRFVEAVHSIGEWISPHRVDGVEELIWRYYAEPESGWYLCRNKKQLTDNKPVIKRRDRYGN